jgi:tetratricopeptide (TPR) repeat protein
MSSSLSQAIELHQSGRLEEAEKLYRAALSDEPKLYEARYNLGMIYGKQGRVIDAARELALAAEARPDSGEAWFMLCEFAGYAEKLELSRFAGEQAVRLLADNARAWLRYGIALSRLERDDDAISAFRQAVEIDPSLTSAWLNMGVAYKNLGRPLETLEACHAAFLSLGQEIPDETQRDVDDDAYGILDFHLALVELLLGDYRQGFARFRARFRGGTNWKRITTTKPVWRGEKLAGKTILITTEGGYGDALMMLRYLPMLKAQGARVLFRAPPALVTYLGGWNGADVVFPVGAAVPGDYDYHAAIFDLPHRFGTTIDNIPADVPYVPLPPPSDKTRLAADGRRRVGVAWAGDPSHQHDKKRSLPLTEIAKLFAVPNVAFYSLTRDAKPGEREDLARYNVIDLAPKLGDFSDSAQLVGQMDLVITCDSALAHLAGAMGKPVWTMLALAPDWRWYIDRPDDTPWYPTMRLFRQSRRNDWGDVMDRVRRELGLFLSLKGGGRHGFGKSGESA